jgi:hypothetical protein
MTSKARFNQLILRALLRKVKRLVTPLLAEDAQAGIGELQILELEGQDLTGTQAIQ